MLCTIMTRFIKKNEVGKAKQICDLAKIDIASKAIRLGYKEVDIGFGARKILLDCKNLSEAQKMEFKVHCIDFLAAVAAKLIERSPLRYRLVRAVSCLSPTLVLNNCVLSEKRMGALLLILYDTNNISADVADKAKGQFAKLCCRVEDELQVREKEFMSSNSRLDSFYFDLLGILIHTIFL